MRRSIVVAFAAFALHCQPRKPEPMSTPTDSTPSHPPVDATAPSPADASSTTSCVDALRALAAGDYAAWTGLTPACTTADAVAALGPGGPDMSGFPGGSPTRYRVHPASPGAPHGLNVYDVQDRVVLVITHGAVPARAIASLLGEPEDKQPSRMGKFKTMFIWASRGLTLHVDQETGEVAWLYAYTPMTVEEFRASWLARVEIHRTRVR